MEKKPGRFSDHTPDELMLWKKDISSKEKGNFTESDLQEDDLLDETYAIGVYFPGDLQKRKIHVIVKAPGKYGNSFSNWAYLPTVLSSLKPLLSVSETWILFLFRIPC